jgi:hypothetical protein
MGHVIEKDRAVFEFREREGSEADLLLLVKESVLEGGAGFSADTWQCLGLSWEYALWPEIGERAGLCEVGRLSVNQDLTGETPTNMEEYITLYREAIKCARSAGDFFARFNVSAVIDSHGDGLDGVTDDKYGRESLEKFLDEHKAVFHEEEADGPVKKRAVIPVCDFASLSAARSLSNYFPVKEETAQTLSVRLIFKDKPG